MPDVAEEPVAPAPVIIPAEEEPVSAGAAREVTEEPGEEKELRFKEEVEPVAEEIEPEPEVMLRPAEAEEVTEEIAPPSPPPTEEPVMAAPPPPPPPPPPPTEKPVMAAPPPPPPPPTERPVMAPPPPPPPQEVSGEQAETFVEDKEGQTEPEPDVAVIAGCRIRIEIPSHIAEQTIGAGVDQKRKVAGVLAAQTLEKNPQLTASPTVDPVSIWSEILTVIMRRLEA